MKKTLSVLFCAALLMAFCVLPAAADEAISVTGKVTDIEKYGHALLDISIADFTAAGFDLGDVVTVKAGTFEGDMPYFNGYYVERGEYMLRAYPGHEFIAVCINYGKFAETAGLDVGGEVTITLKEKAGALTMQEINSLVYTDDPADYASDEVFANFRAVTIGGIGEGKLYRSASPVNNEHNRAAAASRLVEAAGVKTVMNVADTEEEFNSYLAAEGFDAAYYAQLAADGQVIMLGMPINYTSDEFAEGIVKGLTFLSEHETPYLVHCNEGKDRAGFAAMVLEALMGAPADEILADYMVSYINYYHLDPEAEAAKYRMIAERNIDAMLRTVLGVDKDVSLTVVDISAATEAWLLAHGMAPEAIESLKTKLR